MESPGSLSVSISVDTTSPNDALPYPALPPAPQHGTALHTCSQACGSKRAQFSDLWISLRGSHDRCILRSLIGYTYHVDANAACRELLSRLSPNLDPFRHRRILDYAVGTVCSGLGRESQGAGLGSRRVLILPLVPSSTRVLYIWSISRIELLIWCLLA